MLMKIEREGKLCSFGLIAELQFLGQYVEYDEFHDPSKPVAAWDMDNNTLYVYNPYSDEFNIDTAQCVFESLYDRWKKDGFSLFIDSKENMSKLNIYTAIHSLANRITYLHTQYMKSIHTLAVLIKRDRVELCRRAVIFPSDAVERYTEATEMWGIESQRSMMIGEIGELLTLYGREVQGRATEEEWIEEITDGLIMLGQMANIYGIDKIDKSMKEKFGKFRGKLNETKKKRSPGGKR